MRTSSAKLRPVLAVYTSRSKTPGSAFLVFIFIEVSRSARRYPKFLPIREICRVISSAVGADEGRRLDLDGERRPTPLWAIRRQGE